MDIIADSLVLDQYNPLEPKFSHFTQVIWQSTTEVGCAVAHCDGIFGREQGPATLYVCLYNPPGNVVGELACVLLFLFFADMHPQHIDLVKMFMFDVDIPGFPQTTTCLFTVLFRLVRSVFASLFEFRNWHLVCLTPQLCQLEL